jgi:hypothetical protein
LTVIGDTYLRAWEDLGELARGIGWSTKSFGIYYTCSARKPVSHSP